MNNMNDNRSYSGLVEKYIGTAYDTVKLVADGIAAGWLTPDNLQVIDTNKDFLFRNLDRSKPYFTRGYETLHDGGAAYYSFHPEARKSCADGMRVVDPSVSWEEQGQGVGYGAWVRQTSGNSDRGPEGPIGLQGDPGVAGASGSPGVAGVPGIPGIAGLPGVPGTPGMPGAHGTDGTNGTPGARGTDGTNGTNGAPGQDGVDGSTGPAGPGITIKGHDTLANIQMKPSPVSGDMWISTDTGTLNGENVAIGDGIFYTGTAWEHSGPIVGPTGATGDTGSRGEQGTPGRNGDDGGQGDQGLPGPEGPQGQGLRVLGVVSASSELASIPNPSNGDGYITNDTGFLWIYDDAINQRTSIGNWYNVGMLRGPDGEDGLKGDPGTSVTGPKGDKGDPGNPAPTTHVGLTSRNHANAHDIASITGLTAYVDRITPLETQLGGFSIRKLTAAQYAALSSKAANTFYALVG